MPKFSKEQITDQKRLVRGLHLTTARSILRARDHVHHRPWRVLILPGGSPAGEIDALRELMPKCHITAVDLVDEYLAAARAAGADDVIKCDVQDLYLREKFNDPRNPTTCTARRWGPNKQLPLGVFDLVDLDLCGSVTEAAARAFRINEQLLTKGGVMLYTFSYGRDVVEVFNEFGRQTWIAERVKDLVNIGVPARLAERICFLCGKGSVAWDGLVSVMNYRGSEMPMCALVRRMNHFSESVSYAAVDDSDYENAVLHPDVSLLYDCPADRLLAMRRSAAARKAATTRRRQVATKPEP